MKRLIQIVCVGLFMSVACGGEPPSENGDQAGAEPEAVASTRQGLSAKDPEFCYEIYDRKVDKCRKMTGKQAALCYESAMQALSDCLNSC